MDQLIAATTTTEVANLVDSIDRLTTTAEAFPYTGLMPDVDLTVDELRAHLVGGVVQLLRLARTPAQHAPEDYVVLKGKPVFRIEWVGHDSWGGRNMRVAWWAQAPFEVEQLPG